jgi:hypothetical protein
VPPLSPASTDKAAPQSPEERAALHEHLLTEFGLTILQGALRPPRGALSGRDLGTLALVDPLLPLLVRALAGAALRVHLQGSGGGASSRRTRAHTRLGMLSRVLPTGAILEWMARLSFSCMPLMHASSVQG